MSIYLGDNKVTGAGVQLDNTLSETSNNAVTNSAITNALEDVGYDTWQKPADWVDIRSGALENSVYFLVGHAADFSSYRYFSFVATVSAGNYDVFIDGVKYATVASGTTTTLDWQTLNLSTGRDTTYPSALKTHIVRVTPTTSSATISNVHHIAISGQNLQGTLWIHYSVNYNISVQNLCFVSGVECQILEAITSTSGVINLTGNLSRAFGHCYELKTLPKLVRPTYGLCEAPNGLHECHKLKYIELENINLGQTYNNFSGCESLIEVKMTNCSMGAAGGDIFRNCYKLRKLPTITPQFNGRFAAYKLYSLEPTFIDLSQNTNIKRVHIFGDNATDKFCGNMKGLIVCPSAPFDDTVGPQIGAQYTGLDRAALVNLFKSMPYNVGYTVVGSPTITDGVASGLDNDSDYLLLNQGIPSLDKTSSLEVMLKVILPETAPNKSIFGNRTSNQDIQLNIDSSKRLNAFIYNNSSSSRITDLVWIPQSWLGQAAYIKYNIVNGQMNFGISQNKETWTEKTVDLGEEFTYTKNVIPFLCMKGGSIDLNHTYININGVPWFTGKAAMTKTCNIVGCTGTASLTQEDKNIALDKGWQLTVA